MHYIRNMVMAVHRATQPDNLQPTDETFEDLDGILFDMFDAEVRAQAAVSGIAINEFSLSMLVLFARLSTQESINERVTDAVIYFLAADPLP